MKPRNYVKYLDDLVYWILERESIRKNKELFNLSPPWTKDPIMAENRWCNVHREHDKVTQWIFHNFLPEVSTSDDEAPLALCVARLVNWPDSLQELGYPRQGWTREYRDHFMGTLARRRAEGLKGWTGAYMVTGGYSIGGETKEVIIARVLDGASNTCDRFIKAHPKTLLDASVILSTPGMGHFLVAQVIADLKNTKHLYGAKDWYTWCAPGPGSCLGLNFIHDRPRTTPIPTETFIKEVNEMREFIERNTLIQLCAQNTQNCLCELSKYIRAKHFDERLKNKYQP